MSIRPSGGRPRRGESPAPAGDEPETGSVPTLEASIQDHLGAQLRALYDAFTQEVLPSTLIDLIARLQQIAREEAAADDDTFRDDLLAALPALRAFALTLAAPAQADDLVQETLLKAWQNQDRFARGSNLKAWLFTILRNNLYTQHRKGRREVEDADGVAAAQMTTPPSQEHTVTLEKVAHHLRKLPAVQREALVLVGAQGMTYEAAATVMGCQVGTVKSRVSRSRAALISALGLPGNQLGGELV